MVSGSVWNGNGACAYFLFVGVMGLSRLVAQLGSRNAQLVAEKERLLWDIVTHNHTLRNKSKNNACLSLKSSSMESIGAAAAKCITRAPPPSKAIASLRITRACSEPSEAHPKVLQQIPTRVLPAVERILPYPREDG